MTTRYRLRVFATCRQWDEQTGRFVSKPIQPVFDVDKWSYRIAPVHRIAWDDAAWDRTEEESEFFWRMWLGIHTGNLDKAEEEKTPDPALCSGRLCRPGAVNALVEFARCAGVRERTLIAQPGGSPWGLNEDMIRRISPSPYSAMKVVPGMFHTPGSTGFPDERMTTGDIASAKVFLKTCLKYGYGVLVMREVLGGSPG